MGPDKLSVKVPSRNPVGDGAKRVALALLCVSAQLIMTSCRDTFGGDSLLQNDGAVKDLLATDRATAILFYSPADCFSCITPIGEWRDVAESKRVRVVLVLDRTPNAEEMRALKLQRLRVDAVYERPLVKRRATTPRELLYDSLGRSMTRADDPRKGVTSALKFAVGIVRSAGASDFAPYVR